jgi:hypothetical protein
MTTEKVPFLRENACDRKIGLPDSFSICGENIRINERGTRLSEVGPINFPVRGIAFFMEIESSEVSGKSKTFVK